MSASWIALAVLFISRHAAPMPVALRFHLRPGDASTSDLEQVRAAVRRGFFSDSSVVSPADPPDIRRLDARPSDSTVRSPRGMTVIVDGSVAATGDRVEVQLRLLNVLAQPITRTDTLRFRRVALDSTLEAAGNAYAAALARRFSNRRPSNTD